MATNKNIEELLSSLQNTINFESVFRQVFERIVDGKGHGLMILQGPSKKANKTFFLGVIKAFQKGVPPNAKACFSQDLQRLLVKVDMSHYQCVDIEEDCPTGVSDLHEVVLYLALPFALTFASQTRGLRKGHKTVILMDNLHQFLRHYQTEQSVFLKQIAKFARNRKEVTFLGAYTLDYHGKGLENTALSDYVLALG